MKNYLFKALLAGYLALSSFNIYSQASNVPGFNKTPRDNKNEKASQLPLDITIPLIQIEDYPKKSDFYDSLLQTYEKVRVIMDRNQKPTLAPERIKLPKKADLEIKVEVEIK